jgi:capsular exopolysaccharide synthesis family protein
VTLADHLSVLRKSWWVLVVALIGGISLALSYNASKIPLYESHTRLFVSTLSAGSTSELLQSNFFIQQRVRSYAEVVATPAVLTPVISDLGLDTTAEALANFITVSVPDDTVIINISVRNVDPELAQAIADKVGLRLADLVVSLEPEQEGASAPVKLSVVQPATLPSTPSSPQVAQNLAIGIMSGIALGLSLAFLFEAFDTRIRTERSLTAIRDIPILGRFFFDPSYKKRPLIVPVDGSSPRAEAFRHLRTNIQFVAAARNRNSFVISSAIPGEGKSTTSLNLAIAASQAGQRVLLIHCDLRTRVTNYMGIARGRGLTDYLSGQANLADIIKEWGDGRLSVLPSGDVPPNPSELLASRDMERLIKWAETCWDLVILDSPPILPATDAMLLARQAGGLLLVVSAEKTTKTQVRLALGHIDSVGAEPIGYALTMIPVKGSDAAGYGYGSRYPYGKYGYGSKYGSSAVLGGGVFKRLLDNAPFKVLSAQEPSTLGEASPLAKAGYVADARPDIKTEQFLDRFDNAPAPTREKDDT